MSSNPHQAKGRAYWIALTVYFAYSLSVLVHWIWNWHYRHGLKAWRLGFWWLGMAPEMSFPTFPISYTLKLAIENAPERLLEWSVGRDFTCMVLVWVWYFSFGFLQWFIVVPYLWSKLKGIGRRAA